MRIMKFVVIAGVAGALVFKAGTAITGIGADVGLTAECGTAALQTQAHIRQAGDDLALLDELIATQDAPTDTECLSILPEEVQGGIAEKLSRMEQVQAEMDSLRN